MNRLRYIISQRLMKLATKCHNAAVRLCVTDNEMSEELTDFLRVLQLKVQPSVDLTSEMTQANGKKVSDWSYEATVVYMQRLQEIWQEQFKDEA